MLALLAVSSTATNALGLGLATTLVVDLYQCGGVTSLRRSGSLSEIRIPIYVMIIASVVRCGTIAYQCLCLWFIPIVRNIYSSYCH